MSSSPEHSEVLIIGAGLAGLTAAHHLRRFRPFLIEAKFAPGGRANTWTHTEQPVDLGCSMIHGINEGNPLRTMMESYGIKAHVVKNNQTRIIGASGMLSKAASEELLAKSASRPFVAPTTPPSADESLGSLLLPTLPSGDLKALARLTEIGAGMKLEDLSAKFWGFGKGYAGTDGFPINGYKVIVDELVRDIKRANGKFLLDTMVVKIKDDTKDSTKPIISVTLVDGKVFTASSVICTIPLGVLKANMIEFEPPLPERLLGAIERAQVGVLEKAVLAYNKAWWPESKAVGTFIFMPRKQAVAGVQPESLYEVYDQTILSVTSFQKMGATPHPTLLCYFAADAGEYISVYDQDEIILTLDQYLQHRWNVERQKAQLDQNKSVVSHWFDEPFSLGATSSPITTDQNAKGEFSTPLDFIELGRSVWSGRLGFAGEHTDLDHRGSAAGAVVSGQREGRRVEELLTRGPNL